MNKELKAALISACGSQSAAAKVLEISESHLSRVIHGWSKPTDADFNKFQRLFGKRRAAQLLNKFSRNVSNLDTS